MATTQSKVSSLREQIDKGRVKKLALENEVRLLRDNLKSHDKGVEEFRAEASCQSDCFNELWSAHGTLLEEVQMLRSQVIALRSGFRVESVGV